MVRIGVDLGSGFGVVDFGWRFWVSAFVCVVCFRGLIV